MLIAEFVLINSRESLLCGTSWELTRVETLVLRAFHLSGGASSLIKWIFLGLLLPPDGFSLFSEISFICAFS